MQADSIREEVRKAYGSIARGERAGCGCGPSCCTPAEALGYSDEERAAVPEGADLGLGCGNPQAIAALKPGERVLDLGSGAGFDAFLAARQVGKEGQVIGVDMTPEMIAKARDNAQRAGLSNVEFRLGEIERLPVEDESVDVIMSNCVVNLSPDKPAVFREAFRVLAPGGRLAISDIVATAPLPPAIAADLAAYTGCVAGAGLVGDLEAMLRDAGFEHVRVAVQEQSRAIVHEWDPNQGADRYVASAHIEAVKPGAAASTCCDTESLRTCCEPAEKGSCCGEPPAAPSACGCGG